MTGHQRFLLASDEAAYWRVGGGLVRVGLRDINAPVEWLRNGLLVANTTGHITNIDYMSLLTCHPPSGGILAPDFLSHCRFPKEICECKQLTAIKSPLPGAIPPCGCAEVRLDFDAADERMAVGGDVLVVPEDNDPFHLPSYNRALRRSGGMTGGWSLMAEMDVDGVAMGGPTTASEAEKPSEGGGDGGKKGSMGGDGNDGFLRTLLTASLVTILLLLGAAFLF